MLKDTFRAQGDPGVECAEGEAEGVLNFAALAGCRGDFQNGEGRLFRSWLGRGQRFGESSGRGFALAEPNGNGCTCPGELGVVERVDPRPWGWSVGRLDSSLCSEQGLGGRELVASWAGGMCQCFQGLQPGCGCAGLGASVQERSRFLEHGQAEKRVGGGIDLEGGQAACHVRREKAVPSVPGTCDRLPVVAASAAEVQHVHGQPRREAGGLAHGRRDAGGVMARVLAGSEC